ncbi:MAG: YjgP/YjgQ family permease [Fibrobacter sp.]|jgi:lipopolysaccharide export system permease protein|nr:YjgP/YjgQ family permease [Fibrobacter sp.]
MILYRYIIRELIFPFLVSLGIISFLFVMQTAVTLLDKIISKGIEPSIVLEVFLVQLGWIIVLAVPMAVLMGSLWTFGRMSGDNEITSIKASGQSVLTLLFPVLSAATVITVLVFYFNDLILPDANHHTANLLSDISRKRPAALIEPKVLIRDFSGYTIYTEDVNSRTGILRKVRIFTDAANQDPTLTVADSGTIRLTPDQEYLELTLYNGESHSYSREKKDEYFVGRFQKQIVCIKNVDSNFKRTNSSYRGDREKSTKLMMEDVKQLKQANAEVIKDYHILLDSFIGPIRHLDSLASNYKDSIVNSDTLSFESWAAKVSLSRTAPVMKANDHEGRIERVIRRMHSNNLMINQFMVEIHKKYAIPAACIIFVLIGAPLGIMAKRGGFTVGASYSVLFFVINWAFLIGGESFADKMLIHPAVAMWSGNVLVGIVGIILTILMLKETQIRFDAIPNWFKRVFSRNKKPKKHHILDFLSKTLRIVLWTPRWVSRLLIGRLPTYFLGSFLGISLGLIIALIVIFIFVDYFGNLKKYENLPFNQLALFFLYTIPYIIQITLPIVLLLSSMFSIGKMAKNSEIIAMKASGINIRQISRPVLLLGLLLSGAVFFGGEIILPRANEIRRDILENKKVNRNPKTGIVKEFRRNFFYIGNSNTMYTFQEFSTVPQNARNVCKEVFTNNRIIKRIQAEKMIFDSTGWRFVNGKIRDFSDSLPTIITFDTLRDSVLTAAPAEMVARIKDKAEMSYWELNKFMENAKKRGEKVEKYQGELEFKIALPFMNFIVILLGIAITARTGKKGGAVLFGIGLAMVITYWLLSRFAIVFAQNGHMPTLLGAWIGNIIFFLIGLILYRKAAR